MCCVCLVSQSCPTLWDPMDCSPQAPLSVGILQAGRLVWVAVSFSRRSSQPRGWTQVSCSAGRFFTSWATREAQEYWSGEPIPSPGHLPDPGIKPGSPASQADSLPAELPGKLKLQDIWWLKKLQKKKSTQPTNKHTVPGVLYNVKQRDWFLHSDEVKP